MECSPGHPDGGVTHREAKVLLEEVPLSYLLRTAIGPSTSLDPQRLHAFPLQVVQGLPTYSAFATCLWSAWYSNLVRTHTDSMQQSYIFETAPTI